MATGGFSNDSLVDVLKYEQKVLEMSPASNAGNDRPSGEHQNKRKRVDVLMPIMERHTEAKDSECLAQHVPSQAPTHRKVRS
ncbi:hypothetical protein DUNSADRAFT_13061 [Dunaliella salina]|uniref:Encoded protein n=1 Tax=Dunaliella salina TaxID=3046 RepID=A0ABQ7H3F4_DUNSA|nr:hypothetical protein DUNSADRAFT_13061 [Dunaliella salina]|eukprot:KAF5841398.1 hypothetical protein DUNSADRAFT_13061 [Dunaliella salina]